jgi:hypothetical protein
MDLRKHWSSTPFTSCVGDSHKDPLNNQGETRLKPAKNAKHKSTCTPKTHTQHNRDPGGPHGPPVQRSGRPSSEVRLARGIGAPSGGVRLARGLHAPSARGPPRSRAPTRTCSRTRVRAFNALMPQGRATTLTRLGITSRRCSANSQGGHPHRCSALCGKAGVSSVTLCRLPPYG